MTTIVNSPSPSNSDSTGGGIIIALFFLIGIGFMFYYFGIPAIRSMNPPQVNVPNQIDVNVKPAN